MLPQLLTLQRELCNGFVSTPQLCAEHLHFLNQLLYLKAHTAVYSWLQHTPSDKKLEGKKNIPVMRWSCLQSPQEHLVRSLYHHAGETHTQEQAAHMDTQAQ